MAVFYSLGFWIYAAVVLSLSVIWGIFERHVQHFRQGLYHSKLGYERTGLVLTVGQGCVTLALFAMYVAGFWIFGWKIALASTFVSLLVAAISY